MRVLSRLWTSTDTDTETEPFDPPPSKWMGISHYGLCPAPNGLALVQDFLNTRRLGNDGQDLLEEGMQARLWLDAASRNWSGCPMPDSDLAPLAEADIVEIRKLRTTLGSLFGLPPHIEATYISGSVEFLLTVQGQACWAATGADWRWLYGALLGEILLSQRIGTWKRLKRCPNDLCQAVFFDRSWNNSEVWHNRRTCMQTGLIPQSCALPHCGRVNRLTHNMFDVGEESCE